MPFLDQYGNELISLGQGPLAVNVAVPSAPSIATRRRMLCEFMDSKAIASLANATDAFTAPIYVDGFSEILIFVSCTVALTGAPATLDACLQVADGTLTTAGVTLGNAFIDHPSGKATVASPALGPGCLLVGQYTNFGSLVRIRYRFATVPTGGGPLLIYLKAKG